MNIKITLFTFVLMCASLVGFAQNTVSAEEIMRDIKAGKDVELSNVTIEGRLDFTFMEEQLASLPRKRASRKKNNSIYKHIQSKISFTNCEFQYDVLAYIPDHDESGYTFIAHFEDVVTFKNCVFKKRAMFKHSNFHEDSSFEHTEFLGETTFKHANFK
ncbi:MAG: pentapeptide repeat-containing protein, partial [Bacteroidota bacterium]